MCIREEDSLRYIEHVQQCVSTVCVCDYKLKGKELRWCLMLVSVAGFKQTVALLLSKACIHTQTHIHTSVCPPTYMHAYTYVRTLLLCLFSSHKEFYQKQGQPYETTLNLQSDVTHKPLRTCSNVFIHTNIRICIHVQQLSVILYKASSRQTDNKKDKSSLS